MTEWVADFSIATIFLAQDNNPGDAQNGPSVVLEGVSRSGVVCRTDLIPTMNEIIAMKF